MAFQQWPFLVAIPLLAPGITLGASTQLVTRVTDLERSSGVQPDARAAPEGLSADGRWLALLDLSNAYVRDLATGKIINASPPLPGYGEYGYGRMPSISADGTIVSYWSVFDGLVDFDTNMVEDVFVFDRLTGAVRRISEGPGGLQSPASSFYTRTSGDGSTVAFWSESGTLGPVDMNFAPDLYACDLATGANELITVGSNGQQATCAGACFVSEEFSVSHDGRYVAFVTDAPLEPIGATGWEQVYVRDRLLGLTERASYTTLGAPVFGTCSSPQISADGRFVAFHADATNMIPGSTSCCGDIFVRDRLVGSVELVTVTVTGLAGGFAEWPRISPSGRFVAFGSRSNGYVAADLDNYHDVFVRDLWFGATKRVTVGLNGQPLPGPSYSVAEGVGDDGTVLFTATAPGLALGFEPYAPGQTQFPGGAFLYNPRLPSNAISGYCTPKINSLGCTPRIANIGFPSLTDNASLFVKALRVRSHQSGMLLWSRTQQSTPFGGGTLCVGSPIRRTPVQNAGGLAPADCSGQYSFHFSHAFLRTEGFSVGDSLYAQFYGRDPGFPAPENITLTDAAAFIVLP